MNTQKIDSYNASQASRQSSGPSNGFGQNHNVTEASSAKPLAKTYYPQPITQCSLSNISNFVNININHDFDNCKCGIKECIALTKQYIDEKKYELAFQEARRGLKIPGWSNTQKIELIIYLSAGCNKLEDFVSIAQDIQKVLAFSECTIIPKRVLLCNLSRVYRKLKNYTNAEEAAQAALDLPCSNAQKIPLLYNLSLARKGLKDHMGEKEALLALLEILELSDVNDGLKFIFLLSLFVVNNKLGCFVDARQALQDARNTSRYTNLQKLAVLYRLSTIWAELEDFDGVAQAFQVRFIVSGSHPLASEELISLINITIDLCSQLSRVNIRHKKYLVAQQAVLAVVNLPECSNNQKLVLLYDFAFACTMVMDYAGAQQVALTALARTEQNNVQKMAFYYILAQAYNGLKEYANEQKTLLTALYLPDCSNFVRIDLLKKLTATYYALDDSVSAQKVINLINFILSSTSNSQ